MHALQAGRCKRGKRGGLIPPNLSLERPFLPPKAQLDVRARLGKGLGAGRSRLTPPPLLCRVPRAGRAGEVEQRPGRPWGLTVGKVWPEEEVASSPGRWRPGLDLSARGLRAGSRRGRAPASGFEPISAASGTGLGESAAAAGENNSEVG